MTTPEPGRKNGDEHGPIAAVVRLFLGQLAAVIAIAATITVVVTVLDPDDADLRTSSAATPSAAAGSTGASSSATPATPAPSSPAPSSPAPSSPAAMSPTGSPPAPSPTSATRQQPRVDVLNQSAPGGAAAVTARRLRDAGWRIGRVDDFSGNVSTTTVYWLDGADRKAARRLARDLGGVRVQPGFSTLVDGRLSVVLVD